MDYKQIIEQARAVARPIHPNEDCRAGDVGAVIVASSGQHYTGVCVEFECGIGFCAEHAAVAKMLENQESKIAQVVAVTYTDEILPPCGRCREMMWQLDEANRSATVILGPHEAQPLEALLPFR